MLNFIKNKSKSRIFQEIFSFLERRLMDILKYNRYLYLFDNKFFYGIFGWNQTGIY